jgi:hypothetical protein
MLIEDIKPVIKPCKRTKNNQTQTQQELSTNSINTSTALTIKNEPDMIPEFCSDYPNSVL